MNFGKWIVVAFILFAAFITTLVVVCVRQDISLVSKDYYKEELAYQDQIERLNNTSGLASKPSIKIGNNDILVEFESFPAVEDAEFKLFCPSNDKMDRTYKVNATNESKQSFTLDGLQKGMYKARLLWKMNGKQYYQEEIIYI